MGPHDKSSLNEMPRSGVVYAYFISSMHQYYTLPTVLVTSFYTLLMCCKDMAFSGVETKENAALLPTRPKHSEPIAIVTVTWNVGRPYKYFIHLLIYC